ncbi:hypothetical protein P7K49_036474 [Saguinus oedipus]|uniref:Uncharacterized protein n=1 Tax=Saguinus oedipus TaxID=9490 RepID=A0ABQ9TK74_SAGOE|nr:hypothetical protein P7K49_036474 [Saguinus oedipus]
MGVVAQVVVGVHVAIQALCIQLLLPPSFFSVPLGFCKVLAELLGDFHIAQVTFYLCVYPSSLDKAWSSLMDAWIPLLSHGCCPDPLKCEKLKMESSQAT